MSRVAVRAALVLGMLAMGGVSACGSSSSDSPANGPSGLAVEVSGTGVHEVGADIEPGVWTINDPTGGCLGFTSTTADYSLEDDDADPDGYRGSALQVGPDMRIELRAGDFFQIMGCGTWRFEDGKGAVSADPGTVAGACSIVGGRFGAATRAMTYPKEGGESAAESDARLEIQEQLFTVVIAVTEQLMEEESLGEDRRFFEAVGTLVDFLDDPEVYTEDGTVDASVTSAARIIADACEAV